MVLQKLFAAILVAAVVTSSSVAAATKSGALPKTAYLFSYFINNGEDGLHLAWSTDGLNWTAMNGGKSYIQPVVGESKLMRDPCLVYCPDKTFRMVWTTSWGGRTIGYASSKDLINWSEQRAIPVGEVDQTNNCWAPEMFYDAATKQYLIFWSSTINGRFKETENGGDGNHRTYFTSTKDFKAYTPMKLFLDPGFNCIDTTMIKANGRYHLIFKDERSQPVSRKDLRSAVGDSATGPWTDISEPFSRRGVEGPSVLKMGDEYVVYFDGFAGGGYGAMKTRDFVKWEEQSTKLVVPPGTKHGAALAVPGKVIEKLMAPEIVNPKDSFAGSADIELKSAIEGAAVRYTIDGSEPTTKSNLYTAPIHLAKSATIKAISIFSDGMVSRAAVYEIKVTGTD